MEFLNLALILVTTWLVWRRPEKEKLARALLCASNLLMVFVFLLGTRTSLLRALNY
jgi:uncharacterized membrane protein YozB (DUF420 family)